MNSYRNSTGICKNCGEQIIWVEGIHSTESGWCHDQEDNKSFACLPMFAEPVDSKVIDSES